MLKQSKVRFIKRFAEIAWPISMQTMLASSFVFIDMMMIQVLGDVAVGAMGIVGRLFFVISLTFAGMSSGAAVLMNQFAAADNRPAVGNCFVLLVACLLLIGLPLCVWAALDGNAIMAALLEEGAVAESAAIYFVSAAPVLVLFAFVHSLATLSRCFKSTRIPLIASVTAICINTALNYVLIFGHFGFPQMGLEGAAIATVCAVTLEALLLLALLRINKLMVLTLFSNLRQIPDMLRTFMKLSVPFLFQELSWAGGMFLYSLVFAYMGTDVLAATSFMLPIEGLFVSAFVGCAVACSIIIGHQLGNKRFLQARVTALFLTRVTSYLAILAGLFIPMVTLALGSVIALSDTAKQQLLVVAMSLVLILPLRVFAMMLIVGVLRAGGDSKGVIVIDGVTLWLLGLPLVSVSALVFNYPLYLVLTILIAEESIKAVWLWRRTHKGHWQNHFADVAEARC